MVEIGKIKNIPILLCLTGAFCLFSCSPFSVKAQEKDSQKLSFWFHQLAHNNIHENKKEINDHIINFLSKDLADLNAFNKSYVNIPFLGKATSSDNRLVFYSYNYLNEEGETLYCGILQFRHKNKGPHQIKVFQYAPEGTSKLNQIKKVLPDNWYGALYYRIVTKYHKRKPFYLLLGWDNKNPLMNRKIIEVLDFSPSGEPFLGSKRILVGNKKYGRLIFYYSKQAKMHLDYIEDEDLVVFDHLSPREPKFQNMFQYYGPDFTYDGLKFQKGFWIFVNDLYLKNKK